MTKRPQTALNSTDPELQLLLQDRERILGTLMSNLRGMVYCCLPDRHWSMVFVSDGCTKLTGYQPDDLLFNRTVSYEELTFAEDRQSVRVIIEQAIANGGHFELEYRITHRSGDVRWVYESGMPLFSDSGELLALEGFIQDISRRKRSEQQARDAEARYRAIFENASEGIYQTTSDGQYLDFNPALARIYGYASAQELKESISDIQQQLYVDPLKRTEYINLMKAHGRVQNFEAQVYRKNGDIIWITENSREVHDSEGNLLFYEGTVEDISERKQYEQQIEYQATHDSLTGLPNRVMLADRLDQYMKFADWHHHTVAIAFLDLDHFKLINDSMGHHIGDGLLKIMAQRLNLCVRDSDTVVRLGGDEFVLLLSSMRKTEDASHSMKRILQAIAEPCVVEGYEFVMSCSIGISVYPGDGHDANTLLKHADSAMYKAKQSGRNNYQFYTQELNQALTERMKIETKLRHALENEEFRLYFQPKINLQSGELCGAEALIRWQEADGTLISPLSFIPVAEETGQIEAIGHWVLQHACRAAQQFQHVLGRNLPVAVNVSPRQFRQSDFVGKLLHVINETGVSASALELEITESTLAFDPPMFVKTLHKLKQLGLTLAIDDFGTGYSSMAYLKDFPIDRLKIDKAFVGTLEQEPANSAILKAIVALGHSLDIKLVAEGVETLFQRDFLRGIGCDELQGYWFSKPLPFDDFLSLCREYRCPPDH
jgi:diguanylate cyclase (GGDEF)-like protein/PAS domain S-box-containing protein